MKAIHPLPRLRAKAPSSLSRMMLAVGFVHAQCQWRKFHSGLSLLRICVMNGCLILPKAFSTSVILII